MYLYLLRVAVGQYYYYVLGLIKYSIYKTGLANKYISLVSAMLTHIADLLLCLYVFVCVCVCV